MSQSPFELIHCDIWGPYYTSAPHGHQYFVTIVDDYTRFKWVFLLEQKSDVITVIPRFFNMVETQFNCRIKGFKSENAKELAFTKFFSEKRVLNHYYCVDRPQQNSVVGRKHQNLLNVVRALYFQS